MSTCYLEPEDEITGEVARIRAVADGDAVLVLPPGSRIGTSRINFKLLAREAAERSLNLVAVSGEPQVRALAISAGVPAYNSVAAAENALEQFRAQDAQLAQKTGRSPAGATGTAVSRTEVPETTEVAAVPPMVPAAAGPAKPGARARPSFDDTAAFVPAAAPDRARRRRRI